MIQSDAHMFLVQQTEIIRLNPKHTLYIKAGHSHHDITIWLMTSCYGIPSWLSPFWCFELSLLYPNFPNYPKSTDNLFKQVFHICESERFPKTKYNINKYKWLILLPKSDQTVTEKYWSNKTKPHWFSAPVFNFNMFLKSSWTSWNVYLQFSGCSCSSLIIYLQRFSREKSASQFISALFGGTPCIIEVGVAFTQHDWRVLGQRVLVLHHLIS